MIPSEAGATRTGPSAIGRLEKNDGKGNSSWLQTMPAPAFKMSDRPSVRISTSQCVAPMARRITRRSNTSASSAPARTAARSATTSGRPSARWQLQATNVETMSISPCAKFRVRVAL